MGSAKGSILRFECIAKQAKPIAGASSTGPQGLYAEGVEQVSPGQSGAALAAERRPGEASDETTSPSHAIISLRNTFECVSCPFPNASKVELLGEHHLSQSR
jgi:hypothetical protein